MEAYLWLDGVGVDAPLQWQNYILMRDIFHCTPSELNDQKPQDIAAVLACMDIEARIKKHKQRQKSSGPLIP